MGAVVCLFGDGLKDVATVEVRIVVGQRVFEFVAGRTRRHRLATTPHEAAYVLGAEPEFTCTLGPLGAEFSVAARLGLRRASRQRCDLRARDRVDAALGHADFDLEAAATERPQHNLGDAG
jgi:hypothetical protein